MKKLIALALTLVLSFSIMSLSASALFAGSSDVDVWDGTTASSFSSGSGLQNDPYIIKTGAELDYLAGSCMGGEAYANTYFKLAADIDWGGRDWTPIGYNSKSLFSGHFDGNGQTIYNLVCTEEYAGLFGCVKEGSVKNLKVDYATFTTYTRYAGAIAAWMKLSVFEGVSAGANVTVQGADIMEKSPQIGGLFGLVHSSTVNASSFEGAVRVPNVIDTAFIGGIAGVIGDEGVVKNCVNRGSVTNENESAVAGKICYVGGISGGVGASGGFGTVENCVNYGAVSSVDVAGGVVGRIHVDNSIVKNSHNLGEVSGERAGAVLGYLSKPYVMEGNSGVTSADATKAIGEYKSGEGYSEPADKNLKVAYENEITTSIGFIEAFAQLQNLLPTFNTVTPTEPVQTTAPETTEEQTPVETPEQTTDKTPDTDETSSGEDVTADAPVSSDTAKVDVTEPAAPSGCGSTVGALAVVICILASGFVFKRD